ncbi:type II toxin-antitoxin system HicA family toxin [Methanoculleus formosensis]|uniref:type II toxin-antitoxin system HicA family toxin n=1 Tax=Methanoculleus formosensis TaxID=2590886 RepID=UPI0036F29D2A
MPRHPVVSGFETIKALKKLGFSFLRQVGSHVQMRKVVEGRRLRVTIPLHDELSTATLNTIVTDVAEFEGMTKEQIYDLLR